MRQLAIVFVLTVPMAAAGCTMCDDCYPHGAHQMTGRAGSVLDGGYTSASAPTEHVVETESFEEMHNDPVKTARTKP